MSEKRSSWRSRISRHLDSGGRIPRKKKARLRLFRGLSQEGIPVTDIYFEKEYGRWKVTITVAGEYSKQLETSIKDAYQKSVPSEPRLPMNIQYLDLPYRR